jgi:hypothetical protein
MGKGGQKGKFDDAVVNQNIFSRIFIYIKYPTISVRHLPFLHTNSPTLAP